MAHTWFSARPTRWHCRNRHSYLSCRDPWWVFEPVGKVPQHVRRVAGESETGVAVPADQAAHLSAQVVMVDDGACRRVVTECRSAQLTGVAGPFAEFVDVLVGEPVRTAQLLPADLLWCLEPAPSLGATRRSTRLVGVTFTPPARRFVSVSPVRLLPPPRGVPPSLGTTWPAPLGNRSTVVLTGERLVAVDAGPLPRGTTPDTSRFLSQHAATGWAVPWKGSLKRGRKFQSTALTRHVLAGHTMKLAAECDSAVSVTRQASRPPGRVVVDVGLQRFEAGVVHC